MTSLALVRHGETDWNLERRIQGSSDIPLNDTGRQQARDVARLLARRTWDAIAASPLIRAMETARIIAAATGLGEPDPLPAVVERNYGAAEGMNSEQVEAAFPGRLHVPGRETRGTVTRRVLPALLGYAAAHDGADCIVVTHGGVIRSVLDAIAPDREPEPIENASVHTFRVIGDGLELIATPDPLEEASELPGADDLDEQNPLEPATR